jgi:hypothetical protein
MWQDIALSLSEFAIILLDFACSSIHTVFIDFDMVLVCIHTPAHTGTGLLSHTLTHSPKIGVLWSLGESHHIYTYW